MKEETVTRRKPRPGCAVVLFIGALAGPALSYAYHGGWLAWSMVSLLTGFLLLMALGNWFGEAEEESKNRRSRQLPPDDGEECAKAAKGPRTLETNPQPSCSVCGARVSPARWFSDSK